MFYIWKTNRMTLFCNLFIERPSYVSGAGSHRLTWINHR